LLVALSTLLTVASCDSESTEPAPETFGPATVLERPRKFAPGIQYKIDLLDPAEDVWECEVFATLALEALGGLATRLEQGEAVDEAWATQLAAPAFVSYIQRVRPADSPPTSANGTRSVRRQTVEHDANDATGPAALARALSALLDPFDGAPGTRITFDIDRAHADASGGFRTEGQVEIFGRAAHGERLQRNARWLCGWSREGERALLTALDVRSVEDVQGPAGGEPLFEDCTAAALGANAAYEEVILRGVPYWNASLDKTLDTAIFGHNGLAVGDADGDGLEDLYVCQPGGLPNQLFVRSADGTAQNRASELGVDVCDFTRSALFVDLDGDGDQDLVLATSGALVVMAGEPGQPFRRALKIPITATALAAADADGDGLVDLYVCRYSRPESLWPVPYHDAKNGPSNLLLKNEGALRFKVATKELGLDVANTHYSFAAGWLDLDDDGDQDLYVANDFGRNNLYLNHDGRFREVTGAAGVVDAAAGMSVSWGDYNADGAPDLYVANMFSSAGSRLAHQEDFRGGRPSRTLYQHHARGNTLLRSRGNGTFEDVSVAAGVALGRWAWGTSFVDVDNDGWLDLAVTNGYLTNAKPDLLCSYFWRQVVGLSPEGPDEVIKTYEDGWAAVSELQREYTFNGNERNCLFVNTGGGDFADASAVSGFDTPDDGRALAVVDWDGDGALDLWISSRSAPRLRLFRNTNTGGARSVMVQLVDPSARGGNRDAIGARVELLREDEGPRLVRWVVAGDGFLSQSTKHLHFGLGTDGEASSAIVTWPDGRRETFEGIAAGGRYVLTRGQGTARSVTRPTTASSLRASAQPVPAQHPRDLVRLAAPLPLFGFDALDENNSSVLVHPVGTQPMCVVLWRGDSKAALAALEHSERALSKGGVQLVALGVAASDRRASDAAALRDRGYSSDLAFATKAALDLLELQLAAVFDQPPALTLPTALLIDAGGRLVALQRGTVDVALVLEELGRGELRPEARRSLAAPFPGTWFASPAERSMPSIAAVLRRQGHLGLAARYLALAAPPPTEAGRSTLADAHELLGRDLSAQGLDAEAAQTFRRCLALDPPRARVHVELGNVLRRLGSEEATTHYDEALRLEPENPDAHYSVGLMHAIAGRFEEAQSSFERAAQHYEDDRPLVYFNLGVAYKKQDKLEEAVRAFSRSLELEAHSLAALRMLAATHDQREDPRSAAAVYRAGLGRFPADPELLFGLGRAWIALDDRIQAEKVLTELEAVDADLGARLQHAISEMP
jgi:tetratricopeptide (TPR) repeat protein